MASINVNKLKEIYVNYKIPAFALNSQTVNPKYAESIMKHQMCEALADRLYQEFGYALKATEHPESMGMEYNLRLYVADEFDVRNAIRNGEQG